VRTAVGGLLMARPFISQSAVSPLASLRQIRSLFRRVEIAGAAMCNAGCAYRHRRIV